MGQTDIRRTHSGTAQRCPEITRFGQVSDEERSRARRALDQYCGQDTEGMIWILDNLRKVV